MSFDKPKKESAISVLKKDVLAYSSSGLGSMIVALLFSRGLHALLLYRLQRGLLRIPICGKLAARVVWYFSSVLTGCEISYHALLAPGVYFPHPVGIVIGVAKISSGVTILQGVTIGKKGKGLDTGVSIGESAFIGAGAKIIGDICIGEGAVVGANSVVLVNVPPNALAVGVPAEIKKRIATNVTLEV